MTVSLNNVGKSTSPLNQKIINTTNTKPLTGDAKSMTTSQKPSNKAQQ
jgi:hypothetical protein